MPAGQERVLRRRIRSVQSTQKITRAMELIASSRIVRAQQAITAAKPYAEHMQAVVSELSATPEARGHWVFAGGGDGKAVVVIGADRGLSGAFNSSVLRVADDLLSQLSTRGPRPAVVAVGRKVVAHFNFKGQPVADRFEGMADRPRFEDAQAIVAALQRHLETGSIGEVHVVSTRFLSMGTQRPQARRLVPIERRDEDRNTAFEFEPDPAEILDRLLPRWLEAEIYAAMLESAASFHVAQQRAMKAATDNADKLIKTLRRAMNRARQDAITTEIMEIVGGAEALRQDDTDDAGSNRQEMYVFPEAS